MSRAPPLSRRRNDCVHLSIRTVAPCSCLFIRSRPCETLAQASVNGNLKGPPTRWRFVRAHSGVRASRGRETLRS